MQLEGLKQLVEAIGWEAALKVVAVWGGHNFYVPDKYNPNHLITKLLGENETIALIAYCGGQTVDVPRVKLDHILLEANVLRLIEKGFSLREAGRILDVTGMRLTQISNKHGLAWKNGKQRNTEKHKGGGE